MDTPFNFNNLTLLGEFDFYILGLALTWYIASVATAVATNNYPNALTVGCEPLDRFMYFRFGFAWSPGEPIPHVSTSRELAEMRKILGDTLSPLSETYATSMLQFIGSLVDIGHPPEELWDLTSNVPAYFKAYVPFKGHVQYRNKLGLTVFNGVKYYFLLPLDTTHTASSKRDRSWFLVTQQATAVLESLRRGHTTRLQAATYFLNRGIPFSTRTATSKFGTFPPCSTSGRRFAPSFRPAGYKFTKEDFALYNKRLAEFLKEPRARVALLQGGILWRLVKMCQPDYLDNVLEGPVLDSKHKHMFASPDGQQEFWDDVLEESDIEVICGVYQLTTGNCQFCFFGAYTCFSLLYSKPSSYSSILVAAAFSLA